MQKASSVYKHYYEQHGEVPKTNTTLFGQKYLFNQPQTLYANLLLHLAADSVNFLFLLDNGVMKTPKRRFLSLIFACL